MQLDMSGCLTYTRDISKELPEKEKIMTEQATARQVAFIDSLRADLPDLARDTMQATTDEIATALLRLDAATALEGLVGKEFRAARTAWMSEREAEYTALAEQIRDRDWADWEKAMTATPATKAEASHMIDLLKTNGETGTISLFYHTKATIAAERGQMAPAFPLRPENIIR